MKILKTICSMILCITLITVLSACGGGGSNATSTASSAKQGVTFSFSKDALVTAKTTNKSVYATVPITLDPTARYVKITLTGENGTTDYQTDIYTLNGSYISATIPLTPGNYSVTQFLVLDSNSHVLYLVPTQSAADDLKRLVSPVLPISVTVTKDVANTVTLQVLTPDNSTPQDFGYPTVAFSIVNYARLMTVVQKQDFTTTNLQVTDANLKVNGVDYSHPALTTTLRVAEAESYTLVFSKTGYDTKTITLTAAEIANFQTAPLVVTLTPTVYHTVTFNSNGGSVVATQSIEHGKFVTKPVPEPVKTGYTFAGWYSNDNLTDPQFNFNTPITADITLYAKWTSIPGKVITWNGVGGILIDGSIRTSPYAVPEGRTTMTVHISGGRGGSSVSNSGGYAELRIFTGIPISNSTYTIIMGQPGGSVDGPIGVLVGGAGGGGGGGASTIKIGGTYIAGAAGGDGAGGDDGTSSSPSTSGGSGGGGDFDGTAGDDALNDLGGSGGSGGVVNTGGLPVGGTITGSGDGYLEIITN